MSKLITNTVRHTAGSADNITLDNSQNVTVEGNLTVDGTTTLTGAVTGTPLSFRNLIMNGEFIVDQRMGGSATAITPSGGVDYTCDRWQESNYSGEAGRITFQTVSDDVPNGNYRKALKLDCTTAMGAPSGNDWMGLAQFIEAQDVRFLGHGTSDAKSFTLQFWIKSTKTGTASVTVLRHDASREYVAEYTISSSDTWEKKTITIPGDTTGTEAAMDNGRGFLVSFSLFAGSSRHGTLDEWRAQNGGYTGASSNQVNLLDSTSNNIFFTGVQLEAGDTATDYEHRSYGDELARCRRYFQNWDCAGYFAAGGATSAGASIVPCHYATEEMRATPTVTLPNTTSSTSSGEIRHSNHTGSTPATAGTIGVNSISKCGFNVSGTSFVSSFGAAGNTVYLYTDSCQIKINAEL